MAKLLIFVTLLCGFCFAQEPAQESETSVDMSLWAQDGGQLAPWLFYNGEKFTFEERYNWDDAGILGACVGKPIKVRDLKLIPEACGYTGKHSGFGPEFWVNADTKRFFLSSYVQYAKMYGTNSYGYSWFQSDYKVHKHFGIGLGAQALKDGKLPVSTDVGLNIVFRTKKFYVNFLPLWRVTPEGRGQFTNYIGAGFSF